MCQEGRTQKTIRNTFYSLIYKLLDVLMAFILRTIFIKTLSVTYLGVQGLFSNILTVLSLFEAGVGSATVFSLYEPLANNDYKRVAAFMKLFCKIYNVIGFLIAIIGFIVTPFLKYIVNLDEPIDNLCIIYWLTVISTSITYFFSYRRTLLIADQRSDINTKNKIIFKITRFILLVMVLICTKNFILYLLVDIVNNLISNIHITQVVKKRYSYIEEENVLYLTEEEKKLFIKYMSAGIFSKIGQTVVTSTDSIFISAFISTTMVGFYSNYNLIFSNLDIFVYILFSNLTAAIGNFAVEKNQSDAKSLFNKLYFINYILVAIITVCIFCLATPFITIWLGKEYVLGEETVYVIALNFYITSMCNVIGNFLSSRGILTYKNRFRPLIEAVVNFVLSVVFVYYFDLGIMGIFLGTTVCYICGRIWLDSYVLYKYWFEIPFFEFIKIYLRKFILTILLVILCKHITNILFRMCGINIISWILAGIIIACVCIVIIYILYRETEEFKFLKDKVKSVLVKQKYKS